MVGLGNGISIGRDLGDRVHATGGGCDALAKVCITERRVALERDRPDLCPWPLDNRDDDIDEAIRVGRVLRGDDILSRLDLRAREA